MSTSARFTGPDGREYVSISTVTHRTFARACADELKAREGKSVHWMLGVAKAISVPVDVLEPARLRLRPSDKSASEDAGQ